MLHIFDEVPISREVDATALAWPDEDDVRDGACGGFSYGVCNREYADFRGVMWSDATAALEYEEERVREVEPLSEEERSALEDEHDEQDAEYLCGLDMGLSSTVHALSAAGCVPVTSCNGGCFGDFHAEVYPLVVFYAKKSMVPLLLEAAHDADIGLVNDAGTLIAYSGDIRRMLMFAQAILRRQKRFDDLRRSS